MSRASRTTTTGDPNRRDRDALRHLGHAPGSCATRVLGCTFWDARAIIERTPTRRIGRALTSTDESANGVPSQVAPRGAAGADDYL
jgi:hypothetical protein